VADSRGAFFFSLWLTSTYLACTAPSVVYRPLAPSSVTLRSGQSSIFFLSPLFSTSDAAWQVHPRTRLPGTDCTLLFLISNQGAFFSLLHCHCRSRPIASHLMVKAAWLSFFLPFAVFAPRISEGFRRRQRPSGTGFDQCVTYIAEFSFSNDPEPFGCFPCLRCLERVGKAQVRHPAAVLPAFRARPAALFDVFPYPFAFSFNTST